MSNKFDNFMNDLSELCIAHDVKLFLNESNTIEIHDLKSGDTEIFEVMFKDCTE